MTVAVINALTQRRGQGHVERIDDERLGHDELVAALAAQRDQITDLRVELAEERTERAREVSEWKDKAQKYERQMTDLLWTIERRRDR